MAFHRDSGSGGKRGGQRFDGPKKPYGRGKSFGGGGKSFGGGGYDGGKPMMHSATCAECGSRCQVPFKPNGSKPVLCSNCFGGHEPGSKSYAPKRYDDAPRRSSMGGDTQLMDVLREINNKLDLVIRSLDS